MMNSGMIVVLADATQNRGILKMGEESVALTGAAVEVRALPRPVPSEPASKLTCQEA